MPEVTSLVKPSEPTPTLALGDFHHKIRSYASAGDPSAQRILQDVMAYIDSPERLEECLGYLESDLSVLHQFHGCVVDPGLLSQVRTWVEDTDRTAVEGAPAQVRPLDLVTREILRRPVLTPSDFCLFSLVIQALKSGDPIDIAAHLNPRYPEYYRYNVINELRRAFVCIAYVLTRWCLVDCDARFKGWVGPLFQETTPLEEMTVFKKATMALRLQKNLDGFRQGYQVTTGDFERLLGRLGQVLGPSGAIFFSQVRAIYACENWMGVTSLDLAIRRITLKRPDLGRDLKEGLVRWKDNLVEMQNRQRQIREIVFAGNPEFELGPEIYQELLISIGSFTDFVGKLTLVRDLLRRARTTDTRLFALVVSLLLRNLVTDIRKYQCWGNGEYNSNEKLIQFTTLEICQDVQRILRSGSKKEEYLALEVFWGAVFVYRELLFALHTEKVRDYLKASEKDALADAPATPNRLYLFEKTHAAGARGTKVGLIPVGKAWEPYVRYYQLRNEGVETLLNVDKDKVLQHLDKWLSRES